MKIKKSEDINKEDVNKKDNKLNKNIFKLFNRNIDDNTKDKKKDNKKDNKSKDKIKREDKDNKKIKFKEKVVSFLKRINFLNNEERASYSFKEVVIVMFFSLGLGFFTCFSFVRIFENGKDYRTLKKDLSKLVDTYYAIKDNYYGELDNDELVDAAIRGMVSAVGDAYTSYSDITSTNNFMQTVEGVYEGIGCTVAVNSEGNIVIVDMFEDSPSSRAGLKVNDIITKIDGEDYVGKSSTDVANYIKNNNNSVVKLTILRDGTKMEFDVKREKIEIPYVSGEIIKNNDKNVGYIAISLFSSVSNNQFREKLEELEKKGIDSLVIDVRGNSGGYLSSVTDIMQMFLKKGSVLYQLKDDSGVKVRKDTTKESRKYPVAVIVNGGSASASEILASAIKESYKGFVVGTNTYGKGTVQQTTKLPDGSMVKYTTQNWLTPNGNWINEVGVEPTDYVELSELYNENPVRENDNQLNCALELVTK